MSHTTNDPKHSTDVAVGLKQSPWFNWILGIGIVAILVIVISIFIPANKSKDKDSGGKEETVTGGDELRTNNSSSESEFFTYPTLPPIIIEINGEFPATFQSVPVGYSLTFICTEPYQCQDGAGELFDGKPNQDIKGGSVNADETTKFLNWKCRTRNGTKATMTINLYPRTYPKNLENKN